ncbi:MAG: hypothetical protein ABIC82_00765 [bacterium]
MKKHMPGFVPIGFNKIGTILLILGTIGILVKIVFQLTGWFYISNIILFISVGLFVISLYLIFVIPKE